MNRKTLFILLLLVFGCIPALLRAQPRTPVYKVRGTVYDSSRNYALPAVSVLSTSGKGAMTDNNGDYIIDASDKDSIWFSYLGKPTQKFPVAKMNLSINFDIALAVNVAMLDEVKVKPRNYRQDSIQNRQDYAKVFNYSKPKITPSVNSEGVGFDLNAIINMFRFKKNRQMQAFQRRLLTEEKEKYIKHRFNKGLVRRLSQLDGDSLDYFMQVYQPPYQFALQADEYTFQKHIKDAAERYKKGLPPAIAWRPEDYMMEDEEN